ncbi:MAG: Fmu (Sun) domain-containing protein [Ginsengibacter sp.]
MVTDENIATPAGIRFQRYIDYAEAVIKNYNSNEPFSLYLKKYFTANKKHGSRDRKLITALCYGYFRLGRGIIGELSIQEKFLLGIFLSENQPSPILELMKPEWNSKMQSPVSKKLTEVKSIFDCNNIFPFQDEISDKIDQQKFYLSFLKQPKLFIRIRPKQHQKVFDKLNSANILFEKINRDCLSFDNTKKVSDIIKIDEEAVVQDYNSQQVATFFTPIKKAKSGPIDLWDCCAASGGKSILAFDALMNVQLTVSDTRKKILENLRARFAKAGIANYHSFVADLTVDKSPSSIDNKTFDCIIADLPCSGSGTWGRSPEQIQFFSKEKLDEYAILQRKIVENAIVHLKEDGYLLYVTCSVFKKENEENVSFIEKKLNMDKIESRYLIGYEMQADTLFAALFRKR